MTTLAIELTKKHNYSVNGFSVQDVMDMLSDLASRYDRAAWYALAQLQNLQCNVHDVFKLFEACGKDASRMFSVLMAYELGFTSLAEIRGRLRFWDSERTDAVMRGLQARVDMYRTRNVDVLEV